MSYPCVRCGGLCILPLSEHDDEGILDARRVLREDELLGLGLPVGAADDR